MEEEEGQQTGQQKAEQEEAAGGHAPGHRVYQADTPTGLGEGGVELI